MIHIFSFCLFFWMISSFTILASHEIDSNFSFYDYRTGEKVIEFKKEKSTDLFKLSYNKTSISKLSENFIETLTKYAPTTHQKTSYYQDSLNIIRNYFIDVYFLLRTNRASQIEQMIKISQNIDKASSRFLVEMDNHSVKVQNWIFYNNMNEKL